ncbi:Mrp/NBP35 family ATP-binding protein [Neomegalonema sp.]|uniref:Mrp/NBP35 family ATP-binding protein n=1 Tax=Neomegalonema sp. TaxID=2039713 RepID=UPI00262D2961|nr:Mrp/NBP35 family ATP-binding protein [Neomegalonema sp.]MDD2867076.1 Mrp/NBP35 family ATP-binding protein [Neomegalonema sp.]
MTEDLKRRLEAAVAALEGQEEAPRGRISLTPAGAAILTIEIDPARAAEYEPWRRRAEEALKAVPGVVSARAVLTAHAAAPSAPARRPPAQSQSRGHEGHGHAHDHAGHAHPHGEPMRVSGPPPGGPPNLRGPAQTPDGRAGPGARPLVPAPVSEGPIPGVARIIAVGSGKGGVGKSTVAVNLALALSREGWRVGMLDADVYGPSQPHLLGMRGRPETDGRNIRPLEAHGLKVMSMGFLLEADQSVVWRGPMLMSALQQMLRQVSWGELDALIVDLPPGTGDVQLSLSQKADVTGAVIVSTPQDLALLDARKALDMFRKLHTPVLGVVENMASFCCPNCGTETAIFGLGGAKREAERLGLPFLGAIPLDLDLRMASDAGTPLAVTDPEGAQFRRFRAIARDLMSRLHVEADQR